MIGDIPVKEDRLVIDKELYWKFGLAKAIVIQTIANQDGKKYVGTVRDLVKEIGVLSYIVVWKTIKDLVKSNVIKVDGGNRQVKTLRFNSINPRHRNPPECVAALVKDIERIKKEKKSLHNK